MVLPSGGLVLVKKKNFERARRPLALKNARRARRKTPQSW
jgi:hypothetical protein